MSLLCIALLFCVCLGQKQTYKRCQLMFLQRKVLCGSIRWICINKATRNMASKVVGSDLKHFNTISDHVIHCGSANVFDISA